MTPTMTHETTQFPESGCFGDGSTAERAASSGQGRVDTQVLNPRGRARVQKAERWFCRLAASACSPSSHEAVDHPSSPQSQPMLWAIVSRGCTAARRCGPLVPQLTATRLPSSPRRREAPAVQRMRISSCSAAFVFVPRRILRCGGVTNLI